MRIPHIIDYYCGDDSIFELGTKLCTIEQIEHIGAFEQMLIIRPIYHFGYKIWQGRPRRIKSFMFSKVDGEGGIISIITNEAQYLVPRSIEKTDTSRITLYKKSIYKIKNSTSLKEIVLKDNLPIVQDYYLKSYNSFEDGVTKGVKGRLYSRKNDSEVIILD